MTVSIVTAEDHLAQVQNALQQMPGDPARLIVEQCLEIASLLLAKNSAYGNAALNPLSIFSRGTSAVEKINVRLDDKLSRVARGHDYDDEDVEVDVMGYLVLRRIAKKHSTRVPRERGATS